MNAWKVEGMAGLFLGGKLKVVGCAVGLLLSLLASCSESGPSDSQPVPEVSSTSDPSRSEITVGIGGNSESRFVKHPLVLPDVIAEVDGKPILRGELEDRLIRRYQKKALARYTLLFGKLLEYSLAKRGLSVTESEVDTRLEKILKSSNSSLSELLDKKKFDEEYLRKQVRAVVAMSKYAVAVGKHSELTIDQLNSLDPALLDQVCLENDVKLVPDGIPDGCYAVVNGEKLPKDEVLRWSTCYVSVADFRKMINELVSDRMDIALIERYGVKADEEEVERDMLHNEQLRGGTVPHKFAMALDGFTPESYRDLLRRNYGVREILSQPPTADGLCAFFDMSRDGLGFGDRVRIRDLFVPEEGFRNINGPATDEAWAAAKKRIDEAWAEIQAGAEFNAEFVERFAVPRNGRKRSGDLGWLAMTDSTFTGLRDRGLAMEQGQISEPFAMAHGYHIIGITRRQVALSYEDVVADPKRLNRLQAKYKQQGKKALRSLERKDHEIKIFVDFERL